MKVNIIVLNYNGEKFIPECMPSIIKAKNMSSREARITVIDNQSTDASLTALEAFSGDITVVPMDNRVFCSYNKVVRDQSEEIAVLLNNDMKVKEDFLDPMVKTLENSSDIFMVAPKCFNFTGEELEGGRSKGFIKYGWFGAKARYDGWEKEVDTSGNTFQTGFGAVRRDMFLELGGYDDLYLPGRLEDSDICFRAWKRGWKCRYEPGSVVYHMGGASFGKKFGKKGVSAIDSRNSAFFFWKNISYPGYWITHLIFIPIRLLWWVWRGDIAAVKGFFQALKRFPEAVRKRCARAYGEAGPTDRDVFGIFK